MQAVRTCPWAQIDGFNVCPAFELPERHRVPGLPHPSPDIDFLIAAFVKDQPEGSNGNRAWESNPRALLNRRRISGEDPVPAIASRHGARKQRLCHLDGQRALGGVEDARHPVGWPVRRYERAFGIRALAQCLSIGLAQPEERSREGTYEDCRKEEEENGSRAATLGGFLAPELLTTLRAEVRRAVVVGETMLAAQLNRHDGRPSSRRVGRPWKATTAFVGSRKRAWT